MPIGDRIGGFIRPGFNPLLAPGAPTIGAASAGEDVGASAISIAFTAPSDVGGGAITGYTVTARDTVSGLTFAATGTSSPITVTGLSVGQSYTGAASATNAYGPSGTSAASNSVEVLILAGTLWGWGDNRHGSLGTGNTTDYSSPVQIGAITTWSSLTSGGFFAGAVKEDGTLWMMGTNSTYGELGLNDTTNRSSPTQVGALTNWAKPSSGEFHTLVTKTDGTLWAFGRNTFYGALGDGTTVNRSSPVQIGALTNWAKVAGSTLTSYAITTAGTLYAWGYNANGNLGDGTTVDKSSPVQIGALTDWSKLAAGSSWGLAIKTDGTLWAWGQNTNGQLGDGSTTNRSSPVQIGALTTWSAIRGSYATTLAVTTAGTLWAWGYNSEGQLGQGNTTNTSSPVQVGALTTWSKVGGSGTGMQAIKTDGTLWSWGNAQFGMNGLGNLTTYSSPVQVGALTTWFTITTGVGSYQMLAIQR